MHKKFIVYEDVQVESIVPLFIINQLSYLPRNSANYTSKIYILKFFKKKKRFS